MKLINISLLLTFFLSSSIYAQEFSGLTFFENKQYLNFPLSGEISHIYVKAGDSVKKGDLLMQINDIPFKNKLAKSKYNVVKSETLMKEAEILLTRSEEMYDRGVLSNYELLQSKHQLQQREAALISSKAELLEYEYWLENTKLRAPFDLTVLSVALNVGDSITHQFISTPALEVVSSGQYRVRIPLPLSIVRKLEIGEKYRILKGKKAYNAKLAFINPKIIEQSSDRESHLYAYFSFSTSDKLYEGEGVKIIFN